MLELGSSAKSANPADLIRDTTETTFMADVIEASNEVPVIVDFWAPWCGPCKTLGPALEQAVTGAGGKVRMVKVDVDQNQAIAAQLRIQSIPTVYAFWQGQPVDGFQGAVSGSEIKAFVDRVAALAGDGGLSEAIAAAEEMLSAGAATDAAQTFAAILSEDQDNAAAYGGMIRAHLALNEFDRAEALLDAAPAAIADKPEIEAARAQLQLARQAENAGPVDDCARPSPPPPTICRRVSTWHRRCIRRGRSMRRLTSCWKFSAVIATGTMARPKPSFSRFSMRSNPAIRSHKRAAAVSVR